MFNRLFFLGGLLVFSWLAFPRGCWASGTISGEVFWEGKKEISEEILIQKNSKLIIKKGTLVEFKKGGSIMAQGDLVVEGEAESPVVFFREKGIPGEARWSYYFYIDTSSHSVLNYALIREAGGYFEGGSKMPGFRIKGNLEIYNSLITDNTWALEVWGAGRLKIRDCDIYGNKATWGIEMFGTAGLADVSGNYWGEDSGPFHSTLNKEGKGETVKGVGLNFSPWTKRGRHPVILIPGLGEAFSFQKFFGETVTDDWFLAPTDSGTAFLGDLFLASGYQENTDLFIYFYDWRKSPKENSTADLVNFIKEVKNKKGFKEVDLVAFSFGGLVGRYYLESDEFGFDVNNFIAFGTPHQGSSKIYPFLEGGILPANWPPLIYAYLWWNKESSGKEYLEYIQKEFTSLPAILPTTPFLLDQADNHSVEISTMQLKNDFLPPLNAPAAIRALKNRATVHFFAGEGISTVGSIPVNRTDCGVGGFWADGIPNPFKIVALANGDGTVTKESASLEGSGIGRTFLNARHVNLPLVAGESLENILEISFDAEKKSQGIIKSVLEKEVLVLAVGSPVEIEIKNLEGKVLKKTEQNFLGEFFSQEDPSGKKIIFIPSPDSEYIINLKGVGSGDYAVLAFKYNTEKEDPVSGLELKGNTFLGKEEQFFLTKEDTPASNSLALKIKAVPGPAYKELVQAINDLYLEGGIKSWKTRQEALRLLLKSYNFLLEEKKEEKAVALKEFSQKVVFLKEENSISTAGADALILKINRLE
jgi:pimeloyl-ACP methyl ester carboxylesterase